MVDKRKGRCVFHCCVLRWETVRMRVRSLPEKYNLSVTSLPQVEWIWASSRPKVFLCVARCCARADIRSLWLVCGQCFAESGHVAVYVKERWFVADNYRWIYWDFLLRVVKFLHGCWCKELEIGPWSPSLPSSPRCVCESRALNSVSSCWGTAFALICFHTSSSDSQTLCCVVLCFK